MFIGAAQVMALTKISSSHAIVHCSHSPERHTPSPARSMMTVFTGVPAGNCACLGCDSWPTSFTHPQSHPNP
eukprot:3016123-Prorocentrum_lima.AAC.1